MSLQLERPAVEDRPITRFVGSAIMTLGLVVGVGAVLFTRVKVNGEPLLHWGGPV